MEANQARRAVAAAMSTASELGLAVEGATVLNDSNRLVVRLLPCDAVVRIAPVAYGSGDASSSQWVDYRARAEAEVDVVRRLADTDSPVVPLDPRVDPRVYVHEGFVMGIWAYCELVPSDVTTPVYADALERLHAGMRQIDVAMPHFMDRFADAERWAADHEVTPDLADADRALIVHTLVDLRRSIVGRGAPEQLLHGEPHQWNVLNTSSGPLFIDFENCTRGPVEFDVAWVPAAVSERYPDLDRELLDDCRGIMLALVAAHRWRRDDRHPNAEGRTDFLGAVKNGPPWPALDAL